MEKEFKSLSEKRAKVICFGFSNYWRYKEKDVKEFIRLLKEMYCDNPKDREAMINISIWQLDKLAGSKLCESRS